MAEADYILIGRSRDCDVVLDHPTVSGRHARLAWRGHRIAVEDLGSANGTFVRGERVTTAQVRPGDDLKLGQAPLPWSHPALKPFLRKGAGDTIQAVSIPGRRFICGSCGVRGVMPQDFGGGQLRCGNCKARLTVGKPKGERKGGGGLWAAVFLLALAGGAVAIWHYGGIGEAEGIQRAARRLGLEGATTGARAGSPQEASIRAHTLTKVLDALDPANPTTRNTAAHIASAEEGPFKVEQVAGIWSHVREEWRYVNDPRGQEYFAKASESISNDYVGDCDDFAIVLVSMITAIGGEARLVMMDGPQGGHAYAEACIQGEPDEIRDRLRRYYRRHRTSLSSIHYRPSERCGVWLNLDWNAGVPGGAYESEAWAVAIYADGQTETLAPAGSAPPEAQTAGAAPTPPAGDVPRSAQPPR